MPKPWSVSYCRATLKRAWNRNLFLYRENYEVVVMQFKNIAYEPSLFYSNNNNRRALKTQMAYLVTGEASPLGQSLLPVVQAFDLVSVIVARSVGLLSSRRSSLFVLFWTNFLFTGCFTLWCVPGSAGCDPILV